MQLKTKQTKKKKSSKCHTLELHLYKSTLTDFLKSYSGDKKKKNRTSAESAPGTNTGAMTTTECHFTLNMPEFSNSQL